MSIAIAFILTAALLILIAGIYCLIISKDVFKKIISIVLLFKAVILIIALGGPLSDKLDLAQIMIIAIIMIELALVVAAIGFALNILKNKGKLNDYRLHKMFQFLKR